MTRPRPSEVIAGIRSVLADVIAPELTSDHARSRLAEVRAVLAQVDWDDNAFAERERALALRRSLDAATDWIDVPLPEPPAVESLRAYEEFADRLGAIAAVAVERLSAHLDREASDEAARRAFGRLLASL